MFKAVALLTRKPGTSRAEFMAYYGSTHARLIRELHPQIRAYRRNFLQHESVLGSPTAPVPDFDVVTEIYFDDRAGFDQMIADSAGTEVGRAIAADEDRFADRSRTRMYVVDVQEDTDGHGDTDGRGGTDVPADTDA
ncbi:EthD domain-containing protein [Rhodococcus sp. X156]|uniref:EthD domain-containing protein n=1 Tax=Rhodococcus sp. X156 TaxID=2499145 RepID=UPI000FD844DE|nr:EthD domain-containing protein [Rhodococcus sp. X156]